MTIRKTLLTSALLLLSATGSLALQKAPYSGTRIFWDPTTEVTIFNPGTYGRLIELQDGRLLAASEWGGISVATSDDKGATWSDPVKVAFNPDRVSLCVPDLIQLSDGTILVGYNPRPGTPYSDERRFGIRLVRSTDNGATWSDPIFVFDAQCTFEDGCWEPSFLELPSGEVQCYFANENEYTSSGEQCISLCRSFDKGLTWSDPVKVSFRAGTRDGMPVPILLKDQSEIVVIIEDNGWPGRRSFTATTVRTSLADNWTEYVDAGSPARNMIFETVPDASLISAAPYLRMLPNGITVASYQGNEGRKNDDLNWWDMFVEVGDDRARNFKARTRPFMLDLETHANWNSLAVIEDGVVCAVGSIGRPGGANSVRMIKGYPLDSLHAAYASPIIDGVLADDEGWNPESSRLILGNELKRKATFDFAYDDDYIYFSGNLPDNNLVKEGDNQDGVRLLIDAANVSGTLPSAGMAQLLINADGSMKVSLGAGRTWKEQSETVAATVRKSVNAAEGSLTVEAAVPWTLFGISAIPTEYPVRVAVEIVDNDGNGNITTAGIPDALTNQSWSWMPLSLAQKGESGSVSEIMNNTPAPSAVKRNGELLLKSAVAMDTVRLYSLQGALVAQSRVMADECRFTLPSGSYGIAVIECDNGEQFTLKY
jgi:hypothetical protein